MLLVRYYDIVIGYIIGPIFRYKADGNELHQAIVRHPNLKKQARNVLDKIMFVVN